MLNYPVLSRKNHHGISPPLEEYFPAQIRKKKKTYSSVTRGSLKQGKNSGCHPFTESRIKT